EILDLGVEYNVVQKSGSWFRYGGTNIAQGRDAAKRVIEDNPELAAELEAKIMAALAEAENKGKSKPRKVSAKEVEAETEAVAEDDELDDMLDDEELESMELDEL
ncbi:MAG: hypothetical protein K2J66_02200, partial [Muribaculaceae bacterium]|nr:hypothetical protein [Muribaculaceae bacterium]